MNRPSDPATGHVYLTGYRGSGKSTVGRLLAERLGQPLVDTDAMIVQGDGRDIATIFAQDGQEAFRNLETAAIETLEDHPPSIVALGGGAVLRHNNVEIIRRTGSCIYLRATAEALSGRIQSDPQSTTQRPPLTGLGVAAEVAEVLRVREPLYRRAADQIVNVERSSPQEIVEWIVTTVLPNRG